MCCGKILKENKGLRILLIILLIIILGLLVKVGFLVWQLKQVSATPPGNIPPGQPPAAEKNLQMPEGPIYGIWGTVTSVKEERQWVGIGNKEEVTGVINVRWDLEKDYQIQVNEGTVVNQYTAGTETTSPKLLKEEIGWKSIESGSRVYIDTSFDFLKGDVVPPRAIKSIDIY